MWISTLPGFEEGKEGGGEREKKRERRDEVERGRGREGGREGREGEEGERGWGEHLRRTRGFLTCAPRCSHDNNAKEWLVASKTQTGSSSITHCR